MLRLIDFALLISPLLGWLLLRRFAGQEGPSRRVIALFALWVVALAFGLWWYGTERAGAPGAAYHPAEIEAGSVTKPRIGDFK